MWHSLKSPACSIFIYKSSSNCQWAFQNVTSESECTDTCTFSGHSRTEYDSQYLVLTILEMWDKPFFFLFNFYTIWAHSGFWFFYFSQPKQLWPLSASHHLLMSFYTFKSLINKIRVEWDTVKKWGLWYHLKVFCVLTLINNSIFGGQGRLKVVN